MYITCSIVVGIRILSLGVGLLPHLQGAHILRQKKETKTAKEQTAVSKQTNQGDASCKDNEKEIAEIVLEDFQQLQNQMRDAREEVRPQRNNETQSHFDANLETINIPTQTEREALQNMATQTQVLHRQRKKKQVQLDIGSQLRNDHKDDVVITNTVCPPPLFFNSECEPDYLKPVKNFFEIQDAATAAAAASDVTDDSDDDTIRLEDVSDEDLELGLPSEKLYAKKKQQLKPFIPPSTVQSLTNAPLDMKQYPMLNALMTEISQITTKSQERSKPDIKLYKPRDGGDFSAGRKRSKSKSPRRGRPTSPMRERASIENFVRRMHSPKASIRELPIVKPTYDTSHEPQPRRPLHSNKCRHAPAVVPRTKSWLRNTKVPLEVRKTKLSYGLTNSMKLRLEKSNPQLLKSLERKEEDRVRRFKQQRREEEEKDSSATAAASRKLYDGTARRGRVIKVLDVSTNSKPVPTPRQSLNDSAPATADPHLSTMQQVREHYRSQYNATPDIDVRQDECHDALSEENEPEPVSAQDSFSLGKLNNDPGFPASAKSSARGNDPDSYEDDFDEATEKTASRVLSSTVGAFPTRERSVKVSKMSSEDDIQVKEALDPGELLGLRRMTDVYSDDTDENEEEEQDEESFRTAQSGSDEIEVKPYQPEPMPATTGPAQAAARPTAGGDSKWKQSVDASVDSTAYISRSQVFANQSVESDVSTDVRASVRPEPKARPPFRRRNTDSISSYVGEDNDSKQDSAKTHDSDDSISEIAVPSALSMKDMAISKEAKLGYTWSHS